VLPTGTTMTPFDEYTGSVTVTVNRSPARAVFELIVWFNRTRIKVPEATE
jgi:hypothetical protein